jgi:CRISPR-associated endonuclease Csn1
MKTTQEQSTDGFVWSLDIGLGSFGEAVRDLKTHEFKHAESLLLPADFASTKSAATTRRMYRTRLAHKNREKWLDKVWKEAGQEPLAKRSIWRNPKTGKFELKHPADPRLEREFPAKGDDTCYTSCLLRIKLLRGETLEPWQIYKALHSAIQRRGYDPNIPWKSGVEKKANADEIKKNEEDEAKLHEFEEKLRSMTDDESHRLPCYFDAWMLGLWEPNKPDHTSLRIDFTARSPRNHVVPRALVEKELKLLTHAAAKLIPSLKGKEDLLLYGPAGRPYASWYPELRKKHNLRLGSHTDTQGVLSQRIPRFDNRIISKCALIPRLNVCKIAADKATAPASQSLIVFDAIFLLKLKNMRVAQADGTQRGLNAQEIRAIFDDPKRKSWSLTPKQLARALARFGLLPVAGHEEIKAPRTSGRSRFCRPALTILKRLILSGHSPEEVYAHELALLSGNKDPIKGLVPEDLAFLRKMGGSWDRIHIPDQQLDAILQISDAPEQAVRQIIGKQNNPIVRHRLQLLHDRLLSLNQQFGKPQTVVLEFVRWDFMGEDARKEYSKFVKQQTELRKEAAKEAEEAGLKGKGAALKLALFKEQGGVCLYTGEPLDISNIDSYEIDHIVPHSRMGPDAPYNRVLTTRRTNKDLKVDKTPFEWLSSTSGWDAYVERVKDRASQLRNRKVRLLTSQDAEELVEKYTTLAETAWISRLARAVLDATFGWRNGVDKDGRKRVVFIQGGLTARIRRKYRLNSLLAPAPPDAAPAEWESKAEKNRADKRHHALDAMVISFIPQWARDEAKESFFKFPKALGTNPREHFAKAISRVTPRQIAFEKAILADGIFGARKQGPERTIVQRSPLISLAMKPTSPGKFVFDLKYLKKQIQAVRDDRIRRMLADVAADDLDEEKWRKFCAEVRMPRKDGSDGPRIIRVNMNIGTADEYADLSKDATGAYRKGKDSHRGQIIYSDASGRAGIAPVYAHASVTEQTKLLQATPGVRIHGFVQTGCLVSIATSIPKQDYRRIQLTEAKQPRRVEPDADLPAGLYIWRTVQTASGQVVLEEASGGKIALHIRFLLAAGLARA